MKFLLFAFAILFATQSPAWNKVIECNNGELVVDQGDNDPMGRPTYQLVFRGQALNYFIQQGAIDAKDVNEKVEFITWLNTYDGELMGFRAYETAANGMQIYRNYWVSRQFGDVTLRATVGNHIVGETERANWHFHNCH